MTRTRRRMAATFAAPRPSSVGCSRRAGQLTGGSTRLWIETVLATDRHAVALVGWSSSYRGRTMRSREVAVYEVRNGRIAKAWFHPEDPEGARRFFE
jgi:hypothetical protein